MNTAAQDRTLNGVITSFESIPLYGASIKARSTKQIALSDSTGKFSIACSSEDIIEVSAMGFYKQKVKIGPATKFAAVNLKLKPGEKNREYAIGYGKIPESDKLYASTNLTDKDADFSMYKNIYDLIQARFPGVQIKNKEIIVRGNQSFMSDNYALIILNGSAVDSNTLSSIPTKEIKSIDLIRDGGGSVYGSRGANGVVIIETK
jgi:TonB-dependent SusC/RagA subfamily outer membrane receptor